MVGDLTDMVEKASVIHEQEYKVAGRSRIEMEEARDSSEKAKVSRQQLLKIQGFLNYEIRTYN